MISMLLSYQVNHPEKRWLNGLLDIPLVLAIFMSLM
jgi:hypothetical protein